MDSGALRRAVAATRPRRRLFVLSVLVGTGAVLAAVGLLATSGYLVSRASQHPEILLLTVAIVGVRFFGITRAILRYLERLVSHDLAFRTLTDLRVRFFRRLVPLVPADTPGVRTGDLLSSFVADADRLQDLYLRALAPPVVALLAGGAAVVIAWIILPAAAAVLALVLLVAGVGVPALARLAARRAGRRQAAARGRLSMAMIEIAGGAPEIAVAGREKHFAEGARTAGAELSRVMRGDAGAAGLVTGTGAALAALTATAIAIVAIPAVNDGRVAGVLLAALVLLAIASLEAVAPLGAAAASLDAVSSAASRLEEVTEREPSVAPPASPAAVPARGALVCDGVSYRHPGARSESLLGMDLHLAPGTATAIIGPSGSGKTTLAELLTRFRDPTEGRITLHGTDLLSMDPDELRRTVRLAPQDSYVFATTIRRNLAIGRPGASDPDLVGVLARVGLGPWLESLADGLDTQVGESGAEISGGQRQRIAVARLLLSEARFLIFDEPTTHLDPDGADALLTELCEMASGERAVMVITHEREHLRCFDRVVELSREPGS